MSGNSSHGPGRQLTFEGMDVSEVAFKITGEVAGEIGGAMAYRDTRYLIVEVRCDSVKFKAATKDDPEVILREHGLSVVAACVHPRPLDARAELDGRVLSRIGPP